MNNIINKEILKDSIDLIHIEELSINKIKRCLNIYDDPLAYLKGIILNNDSKVIKNNKKYYVSLKNIMFTIDCGSFKVESVTLVLRVGSA